MANTKQCMKHLLATAYVSHFERHVEHQIVILKFACNEMSLWICCNRTDEMYGRMAASQYVSGIRLQYWVLFIVGSVCAVCEDCYTANLSNCRLRHVLCDTELYLQVIRNQCCVRSVSWLVMRMRTRMQRPPKCWPKCWFCHDKCSDFVSCATVQWLQQCASEAGRRTQDHDKRSNAQTVTLQSKTVWAETLAVEDPSAGAWAEFSQQIR